MSDLPCMRQHVLHRNLLKQYLLSVKQLCDLNQVILLSRSCMLSCVLTVQCKIKTYFRQHSFLISLIGLLVQASTLLYFVCCAWQSCQKLPCSADAVCMYLTDYTFAEAFDDVNVQDSTSLMLYPSFAQSLFFCRQANLNTLTT